MTFYGNILFQHTVLSHVFRAASHGARDAHAAAPAVPVQGGLRTNLGLQMLVVAAIALPGYYAALCFMDRIGRRAMQVITND